jgi:hypothetical protein
MVMLHKIQKCVLAASLLVLLISGLTGCQPSSPSSPTVTNPEQEAIRAYADPATQTTLQGLSENNLAKYTQNANAQFKAAITQEVLDKTSTQINSQIGNFISITFLSTEKQNAYTIVHYRGRYSKSEVGVRMVFDQDHLVAGQWFE